MPTHTWKIGAFAGFSEAREIGQGNSTETRAMEALYATAGQRAYLLSSCCNGPGPCCSCPPAPDEDAFASTFPDVASTIAEDRAFGAAIRDILADPDLDDVAAAVAIATELHDAGELAALYVPAVPTKKLPDESDAPARCPICGTVACPTCGRTCCCLMK
jgi:hypothetical protein